MRWLPFFTQPPIQFRRDEQFFLTLYKHGERGHRGRIDGRMAMAYRTFHVLRIIVAAMDNHHFLAPPGNEQFAVVQEP